MEINVKKEELLKSLMKVQGVVGKGDLENPYLENILIESDGEMLTIKANDSETWIETSCPAEAAEKGQLMMSGKKLIDITKRADVEVIKISVKEDKIEIVSGKAVYHVNKISTDEFLPMPKFKKELFWFSAEAFKKMIDNTLYAVSNDSAKPNLTGIFMEHSKENFIMVGTNGHRLAFIKIKHINKDKPVSAIVPKKAMREVRRLIEDGEGNIEIAVDKTIIFKIGGDVILSTLIDGKFADYKSVLEIKQEKKLTINRVHLLRAIERVSLMSPEDKVDLKFCKKGVIISAGSETGDAIEAIDMEMEGDEVSLRANSKYLIDAIASFEDENIEIGIKDDVSPIKFGNDSHTAVVMVMKKR